MEEKRIKQIEEHLVDSWYGNAAGAVQELLDYIYFLRRSKEATGESKIESSSAQPVLARKTIFTQRGGSWI